MQRIIQWLKQAEAKLDEWGPGAWIAAMILAFVLCWPLGLAILAYMIWSGRMFCCRKRRGWHADAERARPTGNAVFDDYRTETLRRLEEEQSAFEGFLDRLRKAKDQAEFDQFMAERRNGQSGEPQSA